MSSGFKKKIVEKLLEKLEAEMNVMAQAAKVAREAATHEESIAEDKYDTRGLEASYLAGGQAKRAAELQKLILALQSLVIIDYKKNAAVGNTAIVEVESRSKKTTLFIVPKGGGSTLSVEGQNIQVVSPESRLGGELVGRRVGDCFEIQIAGAPCEYEVINLY